MKRQTNSGGTLELEPWEGLRDALLLEFRADKNQAVIRVEANGHVAELAAHKLKFATPVSLKDKISVLALADGTLSIAKQTPGRHRHDL